LLRWLKEVLAEENMDWPSYLRRLVSTTAGTAAGAAAGVAATPGGPIAVAAASVAAKKVSDDLLAQFMDAHDDQMTRIEELSQEMRGRLIGLQNTVGAGLDAPWHTALTHIEEAGRRPSHREQELEIARNALIKAWGAAKSLLERDPRSRDPAALRCPVIAQQIAALYSFLAEPLNTRRWLVTAYVASRNQLNNEVDDVYDIFAQKMEHAKDLRSARRLRPSLRIRVWSRNLKSTESLWVRAPNPAIVGSGNRTWCKDGLVERDPEFEGRVAALFELDGEARLLRRTCFDAGLGVDALPTASILEGARRVVRNWETVLVVFDSTMGATVMVENPKSGENHPSGDPIKKRVDARYRELMFGPSDYLLDSYFISGPENYWDC
jgi:hypothetical protein